MDKIPVTFEYKGKEYKGQLEAVHGAGANVWHLSVNRFHFGQLIFREKYGWAFYGNKPGLEEMADYFGDVVTAWYE